MPDLLTVKESAKYLRIPLQTVYYLVQHGKIPAIHIGGRWRIKKSSLDRDILRQDKHQDKQGQTNGVSGRRRSRPAGSLSNIFEENRLQPSGGRYGIKRSLKACGSRNSISCFWTCNCLTLPVIRCIKQPSRLIRTSTLS